MYLLPLLLFCVLHSCYIKKCVIKVLRVLWLWVKRTGNPSWLSCRSFDMHHQGGHVGELTCEWCPLLLSPPPPLLLADICDSIRREKKKEHRRVEGAALTSDCAARTTCMRTTTCYSNSPLTVVLRRRQQRQQLVVRIPKKKKKKHWRASEQITQPPIRQNEAGSHEGNTCSPTKQTAIKINLSFFCYLAPSRSSSHSIFHILSKSLRPSLSESPDSSGRRGANPQPRISADRSSCLLFTRRLSFFTTAPRDPSPSTAPRFLFWFPEYKNVWDL